jgi:hypothetical protein
VLLLLLFLKKIVGLYMRDSGIFPIGLHVAYVQYFICTGNAFVRNSLVGTAVIVKHPLPAIWQHDHANVPDA